MRIHFKTSRNFKRKNIFRLPSHPKKIYQRNTTPRKNNFRLTIFSDFRFEICDFVLDIRNWNLGIFLLCTNTQLISLTALKSHLNSILAYTIAHRKDPKI